MVNLWITAGADDNAVDKQNLTVMVRAKKSAHEKIINILGTAGAKEAPQVPIEEATVKENDEAKPAGQPEDKKQSTL